MSSYLVVLAVLLAALAVFVPLGLSRDISTQIDQSLRQRTEQLCADYLREGDREFIENANAATSGLLGGQSWAQLLTPGGEVVKTAGDSVSTTPTVSADIAASVLGGDVRVLTTELGPQRQRFRLIARSLGSLGHQQILVLATSLDLHDSVVGQLTSLLVIIGLIAVLVAGISGWWLSRIALLPIIRISRHAERIHVGHLGERLAAPGTADEVGLLSSTLNAMFDRLRDGLDQNQRMVADTSHELRTPLAIMRAELDAALTLPDLPRPAALALERNAAEVDRMSRLVSNLLTQARIDRGELELLRRPMDLREEATTVISRFSELAIAKQVTLHLEGACQPVDADRERIDQVLSNLIDNALKYTEVGVIDVRLRQDDTEIVTTVSDTGPGIPADELVHLFDRFYRFDGAHTKSAGGNGLGLSISREIVRAHGGRIWVDSAPGRGSSFSFALPCRSAHTEI
jgi:heavy metal sensor kinase